MSGLSSGIKVAGRAAQRVVPMLARESLYVGIDVGKTHHLAGFISSTLLERHQRFEHCPSLAFAQSRDGFRTLIDRIQEYVPLSQVYVLLEVTGHYHRALFQYLQELGVATYVMHVQRRQAGLLKSDKRDALGLGLHLYNTLEKGVQSADSFLAVRQLAPPTAAAAQLRGMAHHRDELVAERTQRKNKLTAICDELFPELTQVYKNPNLSSALALRKAFPTPMSVVVADLNALCDTRSAYRPSRAQLAELQQFAAQSIGTHDPARVHGLTFEQAQLIEELELLERHLDALDEEMRHIVVQSREGCILASIPGIGLTQAALILASIGNIANFERASQLKSYFGWTPTLAQSGTTLDRARLSPRGLRLMKQTMYMVALQAVRLHDSEWAQIYNRLVPLKCAYDERRRDYAGKGKVLGRIAGQITGLIFTLLKRDEERVTKAQGTAPPEPELYDPDLHHRHRAGQYRPRQRPSLGKVVQLPVGQSD